MSVPLTSVSPAATVMGTMPETPAEPLSGAPIQPCDTPVAWAWRTLMVNCTEALAASSVA